MILKLKNINSIAKKGPIFFNDVNIDNIFISKKISPGKKLLKYFIGYINDYIIKPCTIILPKTSAYVKTYYAGEAKWI